MMKYLLCLLMAAPILSPSLHAAEPVDSTATSSAVTPRSPEAADTLPDQFLKEVTVRPERAWFEGNKAVFVPTKSEKNLSTDASSLIERMNIPLIRIDRQTGKMTSRNGNPVSIYINGVKADGIDLNTFWPKLAKRVEYFENPSDPAYAGDKAVVNFIMTEYVAGGITRLSGRQTVPNDGDYSATSKLVYKRMTFGAMVNGGYSRDHISKSASTQSYRDVYYNGDFYESVDKTAEGHSWSRNDNIAASFNARYLDDRKRLTHTVALRWNRNPGSGSFDSELWHPDLLNSSAAKSENSSRSLSPQISGSYLFQLNKNVNFFTNWDYRYARNHSHSSYRALPLDPIFNASAEDVHAASLTFGPAWWTSDRKIFMNCVINPSMSWYRTSYTGTAETVLDQWRGDTKAFVTFSWTIKDGLQLALQPGVNMTYWKVGDLKTEFQAEPTANIDFYWAINRYANISAFARYRSYAPSASNSSDVIIRQNELEWLAGNPSLKNTSSWTTGVDFTWIPKQNLYFSIGINPSIDRNEFITVFAAAPQEKGGVVKTYANGKPTTGFTGSTAINWKLFDNNLSLSFDPNYHYYKVGGAYAATLFNFRPRASANYTFKNTAFGISYSAGEKYFTNSGMMRMTTSEAWNFSFTYGNGDLYLRLAVNDIFHKYYRQSTEINAGVYSRYEINHSVGRNLRLTLTYTFGYGKKVDRNINISGPSAVQSGVLGSD